VIGIFRDRPATPKTAILGFSSVMSGIFKYLSSDISQAVDLKMVDGVLLVVDAHDAVPVRHHHRSVGRRGEFIYSFDQLRANGVQIHLGQ